MADLAAAVLLEPAQLVLGGQAQAAHPDRVTMVAALAKQAVTQVVEAAAPGQ
jgi:hypothetical protein